jgi:hypothetical protein
MAEPPAGQAGEQGTAWNEFPSQLNGGSSTLQARCACLHSGHHSKTITMLPGPLAQIPAASLCTENVLPMYISTCVPPYTKQPSQDHANQRARTVQRGHQPRPCGEGQDLALVGDPHTAGDAEPAWPRCRSNGEEKEGIARVTLW